MPSSKIRTAAVVLAAAFSFSATALPASAQAGVSGVGGSSSAQEVNQGIKVDDSKSQRTLATIQGRPQTRVFKIGRFVISARDILPMSTGVPILPTRTGVAAARV